MHTKHLPNLSKDCITRKLPQDLTVGKADQIDLLNRSANYFTPHENFDKQAVEQTVFAKPTVLSSFREFDQSYQQASK